MLIFLKLGGSLITDKGRARKARTRTLARIAREVARSVGSNPDLKLVLGHGSGSFGHVPARRYRTRQGVKTEEEWAGFAEVWFQAASLNRLVVDAFHGVRLPVLSLPPSACAIARNGKIVSWNIQPIESSLKAGVIPVVFGDVAFDDKRGGTILSTEDVFCYLAGILRPSRVLIAGAEPGVWTDYPERKNLVAEITPATLHTVAPSIGGAAEIDVTGGMASKVVQMLALVEQDPALEIVIFSGRTAGSIETALRGDAIGTVLRSSQHHQ